MEIYTGQNVRFTTKHPFVHDYNPLTHLRNKSGSPGFSSIDSLHTSNSIFGQFPQPSSGIRMSPTKRLAKSLPRNVYSDPLTGRVLDFSSPLTRSTLASSAAMNLARPADNMDLHTALMYGPRLAKTRLRTEITDPITGNKVQVAYRDPIESLDSRPRILRGAQGQSEASPATGNSPHLGAGDSIAGSRRRKADSLAYVNPYQM